MGDVITVEIDQIFYLLIPSRFPPIKLYARLATADVGESAFETLEELTNPRLKEKARITGATGADVGDNPHLQNWNHAPFTYSNADGTRFFRADTPALELFDDLQTALAVSVQKREAFLESTNEGSMGLDMRVLTRRVQGRFADCRNWSSDLSLDERRKRTQALLDADFDGVLFCPEERPSATAVSVVNGSTLGRAIQGDHFRYSWDGQRIVTVYLFRTGTEIDPGQLGLADADRALAA